MMLNIILNTVAMIGVITIGLISIFIINFLSENIRFAIIGVLCIFGYDYVTSDNNVVAQEIVDNKNG